MSAYNEQDQAIAGLLDAAEMADIESGVAQENINFGSPVFGFQGEEDKVYAAHANLVTETLDADLVASNVLTTTINGTAIATTYATSHAATMTAHIAAINANATLAAAGIFAEAGSTNRIVLIKARALDLTVTGAVTLGSTQAGVTIATTTWAKFLGVAAYSSRGGTSALGAGASLYSQYEDVNILIRGFIWVPAASTISDKEAAYAIYAAGATQNTFTDSSSGTYDIGCYFRSNRNTQNLALLEVRGLK